MAEEVKFPKWHQPDPNIGAILVKSQADIDALGDWPKSADVAEAGAPVTKADLIAALEAKGVKVDKSMTKAQLAEELAQA